jgi:DNA-binding IclR family transcriptional regulator
VQALAGKLPRVAPATITDPALLEKEFKRIRDQGFSKSAEESVEGIVGYAVPICDASGSIVAAIHASVLAKRATKAHERLLLGAAIDCAKQIEKQLGNVPDKPTR